MTDFRARAEEAAQITLDLCAIPSPAGMTRAAADHVADLLARQGLAPERTAKGSVFCRLGSGGEPLVLAAHVDTLGAVVRSVKANGRLRISKIGGYPDIYLATETCKVHSRAGGLFTGTFQPVDASVHVNAKLKESHIEEDGIEVVLDEPERTREGILGLGLAPGDMISIDARPVLTEKGYLKSRHLDDKAGCALLLTLARMASEGEIKPKRKVYLLFTTYEEVGHGGSVLPEDCALAVSVDMGAVGDDLGCTEHKVSICAKDSGGPYDWDLTNDLVEAAKRAGCAFAVDVYPHYGSDVETSLAAGYDVRHGLLGPGVYASHGYERTHMDALENTLRLLTEYLAAPPALAQSQESRHTFGHGQL